MNNRLGRWLFNLWLVLLCINYILIRIKNRLKRWRKA